VQKTPIICHIIGLFLLHPLKIDPVAPLWVVGKNVRDCADELAVLDDRTTAHALHDATRKRKQLLVSHPKHKTARVRRGLPCTMYDLDIVRGELTAYGRKDLRRSTLDPIT